MDLQKKKQKTVNKVGILFDQINQKLQIQLLYKSNERINNLVIIAETLTAIWYPYLTRQKFGIKFRMLARTNYFSGELCRINFLCLIVRQNMTRWIKAPCSLFLTKVFNPDSRLDFQMEFTFLLSVFSETFLRWKMTSVTQWLLSCRYKQEFFPITPAVFWEKRLSTFFSCFLTICNRRHYSDDFQILCSENFFTIWKLFTRSHILSSRCY